MSVRLAYEKFKGEISRPSDDTKEFIKRFEEDFLGKFVKQELFGVVSEAVRGLVSLKIAIWASLAGIMICLLFASTVLLFLSTRLEASMGRVVDNKLVPAMAQNRGSQTPRAAAREDSESKKPIEINMPSASGAKELADFPLDILVNVLADCYWTTSDGYAHWLWNEMTQDQRTKILATGKLDRRYFSYIRQFDPVNLKYHNDAKYFVATGEFNTIDQDELMKWLTANLSEFHRITPLRWDLLPLRLAERLEFSRTSLSIADVAAPTSRARIAKASAPRALPMKFEVKSLTIADEQYLYENPSAVPVEIRRSIKTLVWLALAPSGYRAGILAELDARRLAEGWSAPPDVLAKLEESLAPKKLEMLRHFQKETQPDRESEVFAYLAEAGLGAPTIVDEVGAAAA